MAEQLSSVPEETTTDFTAPYPPTDSYPGPCSYRESIRSVAWPECRIGSTLSPLSGQSGSNYSSGSNALSSYLANNSGSTSAGAADFGTEDLTKIAGRMGSDGYTQRMVRAFGQGGGQDKAMENWFVELDVDWVVGLSRNSNFEWLPLKELAERWVRALIIIVVSIKELVAPVHEMPGIARFAKASISAMLVFVDAIVSVSSAEKYRPCCKYAQRIFKEIGALLLSEGNKLIGSMSKAKSDMQETLMKDDDTQRFEITQGAGEIYKDTRVLVDYVMLMRRAQASVPKSVLTDYNGILCELIDDTISFLKNLLRKKSELCSDPSLRYISLLNNFYFLSEPSILDVEQWSRYRQGLELTPECENYMDNYIEVSWEEVLSCLSSWNIPGRLGRWYKTPSLAKFQSVFHKTYMAQKFWKVPDPRLRSLIRETIAKRVILGYRSYLKEHPELEKQVSGGSDSPEVFEEMLGQLFEG